MPSVNRRDAIRLGSVPTLSLVAGCSTLGIGGGGGGEATPTGTPDPDAGRDSYGVFLTNDSATDVRARIEVRQPWADEPVQWAKTLDLSVSDQRQWNSLLTETGVEHVVLAHIQNAVGGEVEDRGREKAYTDTMRITPGEKSAPDVANVRVEVFDHSSTDYPWVRVTTADEG